MRTATVQEADSRPRSFTGTIAARVESNLGFRVGGKVAERLVDAGQTVRRGQPLMRLDPTDLQLAAQAQQQAVAAARAQAQQTAADEGRYRGLRGTGAVSKSAYSQIKAASDAAQAQLKSAQAQAQVARNGSGYAQLLADADGIVMETLAEPGQVVAAGTRRCARGGDSTARNPAPDHRQQRPGLVVWQGGQRVHGALAPALQQRRPRHAHL